MSREFVVHLPDLPTDRYAALVTDVAELLRAAGLLTRATISVDHPWPSPALPADPPHGHHDGTERPQGGHEGT
ncbi:hypothetical protein [Amycolatopsis nigrescens]|uniref:hypothetical protein n=1 Tax=Amycolatopsis nigrescens TaxID=381445 RepID=UPI0003998701|nr:hypothetical protein [Amycolatopsis nigrescens]